METIELNGKKYYSETPSLMPEYSLTDDKTFLVIGKIYLFRTVTMIYLGRIKAMLKNEILLEDCAWIPETERWSKSVSDGKFKEVDPYKRDIILFKGAILDITEMDNVCMEVK